MIACKIVSASGNENAGVIEEEHAAEFKRGGAIDVDVLADIAAGFNFPTTSDVDVFSVAETYGCHAGGAIAHRSVLRGRKVALKRLQDWRAAKAVGVVLGMSLPVGSSE